MTTRSLISFVSQRNTTRATRAERDRRRDDRPRRQLYRNRPLTSWYATAIA